MGGRARRARARLRRLAVAEGVELGALRRPLRERRLRPRASCRAHGVAPRRPHGSRRGAPAPPVRAPARGASAPPAEPPAPPVTCPPAEASDGHAGPPGDDLRDQSDRRAAQAALAGDHTLVRQELDLAKAEMQREGQGGRRGRRPARRRRASSACWPLGALTAAIDRAAGHGHGHVAGRADRRPSSTARSPESSPCGAATSCRKPRPRSPSRPSKP